MSILVPLSSAVRGAGQGPPGWLSLQPGEQFLRSWGRSCCGGKRKQNNGAAVIGAIAAASGTIFAGQSSQHVARTRDMGDWIAISVAICMAIGAVVYVIILKRGGLSAVLTDRRMAFREKRRQSEIRLADITRLEAVQLGRRPAVRIYIRQMAGPAVTLPLSDHAEIEEISQAAIAAGARLR
ncbi:MAG: hypothetical protein H7A35_08715 [Planctomycetales bacterium]|nr:MAG: hypothetical protein H7A35_08715 [Planctomycetales bacterium]